MVNIKNFGAVGDGVTLCTEAFRLAIEAAKAAGEGIMVPAGTYLTGTVNLRGVSMRLEAGAVVKGSPNPEDYPVQDFYHNEMGHLTALIVCLGGENVVLDGEGTIDLNGSQFYDFTRPRIPKSLAPLTQEQLAECTVEREWRPNQSIFFHQVKGLKVRGITVLDAPCWTMTFSECENVIVQGLTVDTSLNVPNDDGMHFCSCNGVIISDCHISSGDDCIAISGITNWAKPCENIVITNCVLRSCSKALVLGYVYSHIRNVLIDNVIIRESNRGLTFMCDANGGLVENVRARNLFIDTRVRAGDWWGNGEPVFFMGVEHNHMIPDDQNPHRETPVNFRRIFIEGAICSGENAIGAVGTGSNFDEVILRDISYERKASSNLHLKGSTFDIAPAPEPVEVPMDCGVYLKGAGGMVLENVKTRDYAGQPQRIVVE